MEIITVSDLEALTPLMEQAPNAVRAVHVSFDDFLRLFDEDIRGKIRGLALTPGAEHVVCVENVDMWSSNHGHRSCLLVGTKPEGAEIPTWSLKAILEKPYFRLGDVPSRFQYPVAYASLELAKKALTGDDRGLEKIGDIKRYGG